MKNKNRFTLLIVFLGIISFSFIEDAVKLLMPGKGISGEISIGETTKAEVEKKFGNDFVELNNYSKSGGDSTLYSVSLDYQKQGLKFYFKPASPGLFAVHFYSNYPAITEKGIRAGVSTIDDVEKAYGKKDWYYSGKTMFLEYPGITFYIPFDGKFPVKNSVERKAKKIKVEFIGINAIEE